MIAKRILFLSDESPWPAYSGAALRAQGLFRELCQAFEVELILLTRQPLYEEQSAYLGARAWSITRVPLRDVSWADKLRALPRMFFHLCPYHIAILELSLAGYPDIRRRIAEFPGVVFTNVGHWGALVHDRPAPNWILNQCDADVEFWRVYASQVSHPLARLAARLNFGLARHYFPAIYSNVGRIISVCEEDRQHTLALAPYAQVDVIENGVDCAYYAPPLLRPERTGSPRLLFTGTANTRNMTALRGFVRNILPIIRAQLPDVELMVGGNFSARAQAEFASHPEVRFTGRVDDIRPAFKISDVFVAPFAETHGSKLKIAEAMAMAMPIVSTPQGVRGFPLRDGESVLLALNNTEFAAHVIALLGDADRRAALGRAARQLALTTIDWAVLGKRLRGIVEKAHPLQEGRSL
jgi:glycosyltransferase involved in cell wall biosynthesis